MFRQLQNLKRRARLRFLFLCGAAIKVALRHIPVPPTPSIPADDGFRLVYFCGSRGVDYLRGSLHSVLLNWGSFPRVLVITDGTPPDTLRRALGAMSNGIEVISWEVCASHFESKANLDLAEYARHHLWGRKLVAVLYSFEKFKALYSDTDVLWFKDPLESVSGSVRFKMSEDIRPCYSNDMLHMLGMSELDLPPFNAGVVYGFGEFGDVPHWREICAYLRCFPDNRTEQTTLALIARHCGSSWPMDEIKISLDDISSIFPASSVNYGSLIARHYVNGKFWLFWRDYSWLLIRRLFRMPGAAS